MHARRTRRIRSDGTLKKYQASLKVRTESLPRLANFIAVAFAVCGIVGSVLSFDDNADASDVDTGHKLNRAYGVVGASPAASGLRVDIELA